MAEEKKESVETAEEKKAPVESGSRKESKLGRVVYGSIKFFVLIYLAILVAVFSGFIDFRPLLSPGGTLILFGLSVATYILEA